MHKNCIKGSLHISEQINYLISNGSTQFEARFIIKINDFFQSKLLLLPLFYYFDFSINERLTSIRKKKQLSDILTFFWVV